MTSFFIDNIELNVSPSREAYNAIRLEFSNLAGDMMDDFINCYESNFRNADDLHEKCTDIFLGHYMGNAITHALKVLSAHDIFHISEDTFFNTYIKPNYITWEDDFAVFDDKYLSIVLKAEELDAYRTERRENRSKWMGGGFGLEGAVKGAVQAGALNVASNLAHGVFNLAAKGVSAIGDSLKKQELFNDPETADSLATAVYNQIFTLHFAVCDALEKEKNQSIAYVTASDRKKAEGLIESISQNRVPSKDAKSLLVEAIGLSPYTSSYYKLFLSRYGDQSLELQAVGDFFGVNVAGLKKKLLEERKGQLDFLNKDKVSSSIRTLDNLAQQLGVSDFDSESYRLSFSPAGGMYLNATGSADDIFSWIEAVILALNGKIKDKRPAAGVMEAAWPYGANLFGIRVKISMPRSGGQTGASSRKVLFFEGGFKDSADNGAGKARAKMLMDAILLPDVETIKANYTTELSKKHIGAGLGLLIFFVPLPFAFLTLREGYSKKQQAISIGYAVFIIAFIIFAGINGQNHQSAAPTVIPEVPAAENMSQNAIEEEIPAADHAVPDTSAQTPDPQISTPETPPGFPAEFNGAWGETGFNCDLLKNGNPLSGWMTIENSIVKTHDDNCHVTEFSANSPMRFDVRMECTDSVQTYKTFVHFNFSSNEKLALEFGTTSKDYFRCP